MSVENTSFSEVTGIYEATFRYLVDYNRHSNNSTDRFIQKFKEAFDFVVQAQPNAKFINFGLSSPDPVMTNELWYQYQPFNKDAFNNFIDFLLKVHDGSLNLFASLDIIDLKIITKRDFFS
uniref:Uncharacterized protein n=1 Tax=Panagrolaimus superbus TaxID=310955 RepID=A0A914XVQ9_9BILA